MARLFWSFFWKCQYPIFVPGYETLHSGIVELLESARRQAARSVNTLMTATYWEIGRRIIEAEQGGKERAEYGEKLIARLAKDLTARFGRGFGAVNLSQMRCFYQTWPVETIFQTLSEKLPAEIAHALPPESGHAPIFRAAVKGMDDFDAIVRRFPLPWSAYVRLLSVKDSLARRFYETEALRCGWSVRQLDRQINSQFYERVALSRNKAAMLEKCEVSTERKNISRPAARLGPFLSPANFRLDTFLTIWLTRYVLTGLRTDPPALKTHAPVEANNPCTSKKFKNLSIPRFLPR